MLLVTVILVIGIRESASFNAAMVILKLAVVLFVIAAGIAHVDTANWRPFMPFGFKGVASGAAYVFFAYIGFDSVSTHAEEARNPQRDVPIGIITSLLLCTILYIAVAGGAHRHGSVSGDRHQRAAGGRVRALRPVRSPCSSSRWARSPGSPACCWCSCSASRASSSPWPVTGCSRTASSATSIRASARRHKATILTGSVVALVAALFPIHALAEMVNIGTLFAFVIVCIAVWIMRYTNPNQRRPFRCPLVPVVPILGILFNIGLMFSLGWHNWLRLGVWLAVGLLIYFAYSRHHSRLALAAQTASPAGRARQR